MAELDYAPLESVEPAAVLAAMNEAFGRERELDWYRWKHQEGPWGPSRGWVALDGGEVVGTRLFVPWRLRSPSGEHVCSRAMDGAVVPRARRRGVFSTLIELETDQLAKAGTWHCVYSTSVPASREAYRKLGWTILPTVPAAYRAVAPARPSRGFILDSALTDVRVPSTPGPGLSTAWTTRALRWRTDGRTGHDYRLALLQDGPEPAGLLFRSTRVRGLKVVVPLFGWGGQRTSSRLLRQTAGAVGAAVVLAVDRRPALRPLSAGGSTVSVWATGGSAAPERSPTTASSWSWSGADLEGVL